MREDRGYQQKFAGTKISSRDFGGKSLNFSENSLENSLKFLEISLDFLFLNNRSRRAWRSTISLVSHGRRRSRAVSAVGTSRCGTSRRETAIDNCKCVRARAREQVCACACVYVASVRLADSARRHSISSPGMAIARC